MCLIYLLNICDIFDVTDIVTNDDAVVHCGSKSKPLQILTNPILCYCILYTLFNIRK